MFAITKQQQNLFKSRLSLPSLLGQLLDPLIIIFSLAAVTAASDESFDSSYFILALFAFSLSFPGKSLYGAGWAKILREALSGWGLIAAVLGFFGYASGYMSSFPPPILAGWFFAAPAGLFSAHLAINLALPRLLALGAPPRSCVIVGANDLGVQLAQRMQSDPLCTTRFVGFIDDRGRHRLSDIGNQPLLGSMKNLATFVKQHQVDQIYLAMPMTTQPRILHLLDDLRDTTASIYFVPDIFVTDLVQARLEDVNGIPVVAVCETPFTGVSGLIKRASDLLLASLIVLLLAPLMIVVALGVKMSSPGPILFRQRRCGLDGKEIVVWKFRSMTVCEDGPDIAQATRDDPRVTRFGAFIRRTSLDELPQFFNVLQGCMSIVGPRPHAIAHNEMYRHLIKGYMVRHKVKPGITGLAQVSGCRGETDTLDKMKARIEYDLAYLRNWSLMLDLGIISRTVWTVLAGDRKAY